MIVKILSRGTSFKGLAAYLTHDPKAETKERLAWTHTLNLAHDHVPSAVDEMLWTARNAELLKQEAGIRAGGRATENTVKHISLNWAPEDAPTREHMIETAEEFLQHMKWQEHQAILVAHEDKAFAHVHLMLNAVHPETGLKLDDNFEQRRAQTWALEYEREQGRIHCEQRLMNADDREDAPTRPGWMAFQEKQREFEAAEKSRLNQEPILIRDAEMPENPADAEWKILKDTQRREREGFFAEGKMAFSELRSSIYREVREEFRERWSDYYDAKKNGADSDALSALKKDLVADQKAVLEARRDQACGELRTARDGEYRELLDGQREARLGLTWRQEHGFDNALFLQLVDGRNATQDATDAFRNAADATTGREPETRLNASSNDATEFTTHERAGLKSGADVGIGLGMGVMSLFEGLADGLVWSKPDPKPRQPEPAAKYDPFADIIEQARERQRNEQEEADRKWRQNQRGADGE